MVVLILLIALNESGMASKCCGFFVGVVPLKSTAARNISSEACDSRYNVKEKYLNIKLKKLFVNK